MGNWRRTYILTELRSRSCQHRGRSLVSKGHAVQQSEAPCFYMDHTPTGKHSKTLDCNVSARSRLQRCFIFIVPNLLLLVRMSIRFSPLHQISQGCETSHVTQPVIQVDQASPLSSPVQSTFSCHAPKYTGFHSNLMGNALSGVDARERGCRRSSRTHLAENDGWFRQESCSSLLLCSLLMLLLAVSDF